MPNWCNNELVVSGKKKDVEEFCKKVRGDEAVLDFNKIIPYPKHFAKADAEAGKERKKGLKKYSEIKDGYNSGGYEWCCANWGTKWNACNVIFEDRFNYNNYNEIGIYFRTAWDPPLPVIKKIIELFPKLGFDFQWGGGYEMRHRGVVSGKGGEITGEGYCQCHSLGLIDNNRRGKT